MSAFHPTLISAADDLAATAPGKNDSWWFASRLHDEDGNVVWAKIHVMDTDGACHSTVALLREADGHTSSKHTVEPLHDVKLSTDRLDVQTSVLNLSGDLDELEISGATDTASIRLALRREEPVLFSGGSGVFPFFGGTTGQYALPGLTASGTVTIEGVTHQLTGRTWCDRQWLSGISEPLRFLWLGLDLGAGHSVSVWDTEGDGTSWLTALREDGSHLITSARRTGRDERWILTVPGLDARLEITPRRLDGTQGSHSNVCSVTGTFDGHEITGHGYADVVGT
ncbi:lipocalin-like domain-containing protein [Streptomyces brasiliscabiei]|uniref:Lipocalin-like domain-containing protein n=1 Tax=Streptomyces brasiliscabiei TaxID=2736302 RepID=A0ABU8GN17_9ACTN